MKHNKEQDVSQTYTKKWRVKNNGSKKLFDERITIPSVSTWMVIEIVFVMK